MKNPKILYISPNRDFSGYAEAARHYIRALDMTGCNLVTRSLHYDGGEYLISKREEELASRDLHNVDIIISQTTPNETERKPGVFNVNFFCWETDRVPPEWVNQLNQMDLAVVPCDENLKVSRKSGVVIPMEKVHFAFDTERYKIQPRPFFMPGTDDTFKLLTICQITKKKGVDVLLKAYLSEFTPQDNALLMLKVYSGPNDTDEHRQRTVNQVNKIKELMRLEAFPQVMVIHHVMNYDAISRLYSSANCYVLPSRGEGWSITHFDAMGFGTPPIAINWGGPTEFITQDEGWLVKYNMSPVFDMPHPHHFMYTARDNWAEPHVDDLKKAMRDAYQEWKMYKVHERGSIWSQRIENCKRRVEDFSYEKIGPQLKDALMKHYTRWKVNGGL